LKNLYFVIPAVEPEMDSIPYLRERQLPPTPLIEGGAGGSSITEGDEGGSSLTEGGEDAGSPHQARSWQVRHDRKKKPSFQSFQIRNLLI